MTLRINNFSLMNMLILLWNNLTLKRKKQLVAFFFLIFISGIAEMISIGAVVPFLFTFTAPEKLFDIIWLKNIFFIFGFQSPDQLLIPSTIIFLLVIIISALIRLTNLWLNNRMAAAIGSDIYQ
tara:strand:+ start:1629 stop:2000 length:372 start_codon:yes stop_codon:yes gene_type:complete